MTLRKNKDKGLSENGTHLKIYARRSKQAIIHDLPKTHEMLSDFHCLALCPSISYIALLSPYSDTNSKTRKSQPKSAFQAIQKSMDQHPLTQTN